LKNRRNAGILPTLAMVLCFLFASQLYAENFKVIKLADNTITGTQPQVFKSKVVWQGRNENGFRQIFFYHGKKKEQLTDSHPDNINPQSSGNIW